MKSTPTISTININAKSLQASTSLALAEDTDENEKCGTEDDCYDCNERKLESMPDDMIKFHNGPSLAPHTIPHRPSETIIPNEIWLSPSCIHFFYSEAALNTVSLHISNCHYNDSSPSPFPGIASS